MDTTAAPTCDTGEIVGIKFRRKKSIILVTVVAFLICCIAGVEIYNGRDKEMEINASSEEIDLYAYEPFYVHTKAKSLDGPSALKLDANLPRLDGATALYPLYAAFVRAVYPEAQYRAYNDESIIRCTRTSGAFARLIDGETDVAFMMGVSPDQQEAAAERGLEIKLTPVGREAFVFFVNRRNPAVNLAATDIINIYSGQINNWKQFGGGNHEIRAYQRPSASGSQIMLREIMGDVEPVVVPDIDYYDEMKGMYNAVAYKNYRNSLGYSFLYYIRDMIAENEIKFLSIDGIAPVTESIADGSYPFAHDFYAVTIVREPEDGADALRMQNAEDFINWIRSPQGQSLVEKTGYVPLTPP